MSNSSRIVSVLCTLGPASLNRSIIERLEARGVDLFRINLSHTPLPKVAECIDLIQSLSSVPVCLDTEGAQVRTGLMQSDVVVRDRQHLFLTADSSVVGDSGTLALTPASVFATLKPNTLVSVDFDGVVLLVLDEVDGGFDTVVLNGGRIGTNKAVVIDPAPVLPPLSEKDIAAVQIGLEKGVRHFALSFTNSADDVRELREIVGFGPKIISKIESKRGVLNIDGILAAADEILIDRGDLSREVPLENLPFLQKSIIRKANAVNKPVNVATNLLESMLVNAKPTRAELNDIVNTMLDGANGLVLAAETAIGKHPVAAVDMVLGLIERYRLSLEGYRMEDLLDGGSVLLPNPHGEVRASSKPFGASRLTARKAAKFPAIEVDLETAMDIEQIAHGVYSPLQGFMTEEELESVLENNCLPSGQVWTMPILLQGRSQEFAAFHPGQSIRLIDRRTGQSTAMLHLEDKYEVKLDHVAHRWFGTTDQSHPGVAKFMNRGITMLGGPVEYMGSASVARSPYQLTPKQTRMLFDIKGWTKIVAFHTRNAPHRGHEHVITHACERCNADGILIHPVIGPKKPGDFTQQAILTAYEQLITARVPNALLAAFSTYSRYCGPREAVFTALCRKNFGCTHFVMGRDHTGVGSFYTVDANRELFESLGDFGIKPVFFDPIHYSAEAGTTVESRELNGYQPISGSLIRGCLVENRPISESLMGSDISGLLMEMQKSGQQVFVT